MQKILGPIPHFQTHCCFHFGMNSSTIWPPAVILQSLLVPEVTPGTWSNMLNLHTLAPSPSQCLKQPALSVLHHIHLIYLPPWNFRASPSQSEQQRICTTQCCWRWIQMCSMCSICSMSSSSRWWFSAPIQGTGGLRDVPDPWPSNTVLSSLQLAKTHKQTSILRHTEHILILRSEWFFSWWLCHVELHWTNERLAEIRPAPCHWPSCSAQVGALRRWFRCKIQRYSPWGIPAIKHEDTWSLNSRKSQAITLNISKHGFRCFYIIRSVLHQSCVRLP